MRDDPRESLNPYAPPTPETSAPAPRRVIRYVTYRYALSLFFFTYSGQSNVIELAAGQSAWVRGLPYTVLSLLLGWWGLPWGPIRTLQALITNLGGGEDVRFAARDTSAATREAYVLEEPDAQWTCPQCTRQNPNTSFRCSCGYSLV